MKRNVKLILVRDAQGNGEGMHYKVRPDGETTKELAPAKSILHDNTEAMVIGIEFAQEGKAKQLFTGAQQEALFGKIVEISDKYPSAKIADTVCGAVHVKTWLANYVPLDLAA